MSLIDAVPYVAFSGVQWLPGAALAEMTLCGSCGSSPTRLDGADSTAGAPAGGVGTTASAELAVRPAQAQTTAPAASARVRVRSRRGDRDAMSSPPIPEAPFSRHRSGLSRS